MSEKIKKQSLNIKTAIIGGLAGIICGLFGTGGGIILVPAFIYMLDIEPKKARATSLCCMLAMVIASSFFYYKNNYINWNSGLLCAIGGIFWRIYRCNNIKKSTRLYFKNFVYNFYFILCI